MIHTEENKQKILNMIEAYGRVSIYEIPIKFRQCVDNLIEAKILNLKSYEYDTELREHLSTFYVEKTR